MYGTMSSSLLVAIGTRVAMTHNRYLHDIYGLGMEVLSTKNITN